MILCSTISVQLLQFDAVSHLLGCVPCLLFHSITLSFLSVLNWTATWPPVLVFFAVLINGTFVLAFQLLCCLKVSVFMHKPTVYSSMSLKMFRIVQADSSVMLRKKNDKYLVHDGWSIKWFSAHTGPVPASVNMPNLTTISLMDSVHRRAPLSDHLNIITGGSTVQRNKLDYQMGQMGEYPVKYIIHVDTCQCQRPCDHKSHIIMQCVKAEKAIAHGAPMLLHMASTVKFTRFGMGIASRVSLN